MDQHLVVRVIHRFFRHVVAPLLGQTPEQFDQGLVGVERMTNAEKDAILRKTFGPTTPPEHHIFHVDCSAYVPGGRVIPFVPQPNDTDQAVLSQIALRCDGCGTRIHVDVWPMQDVDPKRWGPRSKG